MGINHSQDLQEASVAAYQSGNILFFPTTIYISDRKLQPIWTRTSPHKISFFPSTIRLLNKTLA